MTEAATLVAAHSARLIGWGTTLGLAAFLIFRVGARASASRALLAAGAAVAGGLLVEYAVLPLTVLIGSPRAPLDLLTFKVVDVSTGLVALGYAWLIFAVYRILRR